jgi:hypothetical protein
MPEVKKKRGRPRSDSHEEARRKGLKKSEEKQRTRRDNLKLLNGNVVTVQTPQDGSLRGVLKVLGSGYYELQLYEDLILTFKYETVRDVLVIPQDHHLTGIVITY